MLITIFIIVLFFVLGIIFYSGRGSSLIAGYNTMPEEEKAKYDTVALCKFMGKMMFALSLSMLFWYLVMFLKMIYCSLSVSFFLAESLFLCLFT